MKKILAALFAFGLVLQAAQPIPRQAKPYTFKMPDGTTQTLASMKGKVVVIQFLYTWCEHCQNTARMLSNVQAELGSQGVQVVGVAFNDEVNTDNAAANNAMTKQFDTNFTNFPVALAPQSEVLSYLGISVMERYAVPQIMVIDKNGVVRDQTKPLPEGRLQNETFLKDLLRRLLSES